MKEIDKTRKLLGGIVDPQAAYAIGRGIKTLSVRMERHNANGLAVARWLETQKGTRVETVYYPGLESHPDHALAKKQMKGFGGMVCVDVGGGQARAEAVLRSAQGLQARRQPGRRREPVQPAGA